jgi:erythromycin esterase-like protein
MVCTALIEDIGDRPIMMLGETLDRLVRFHAQAAAAPGQAASDQTTPGGSSAQAKALVWAHNTHIGDGRATPMHAEKMINIGQLARQQYGNDNVYLIGFSGYAGTVNAPSASSTIPEETEWGITSPLCCPCATMPS